MQCRTCRAGTVIIPVISPFGTLGGPHTQTTLSTAFGLKTSSGSIMVLMCGRIIAITKRPGIGVMHAQSLAQYLIPAH